MDRETIIARFEEFLLGNEKSMYKGDNPVEAREIVATCWRYVVRDILGYSPKEALEEIDDKIMARFKLDYISKKYPAPDSLGNSNIKYYLSLAFPNQIKFDESAEAINIYKQVIKGNCKWPKSFFKSEKCNGYLHARAILCYVVMTCFKNSEEAYKFFADKKMANQFLAQHRLDKVCDMLYGNRHIEYLHDSLPLELQNEFLKDFYLFNLAIKPKIEEQPLATGI